LRIKQKSVGAICYAARARGLLQAFDTTEAFITLPFGLGNPVGVRDGFSTTFAKIHVFEQLGRPSKLLKNGVHYLLFRSEGKRRAAMTKYTLICAEDYIETRKGGIEIRIPMSMLTQYGWEKKDDQTYVYQQFIDLPSLYDTMHDVETVLGYKLSSMALDAPRFILLVESTHENTLCFTGPSFNKIGRHSIHNRTGLVMYANASRSPNHALTKNEYVALKKHGWERRENGGYFYKRVNEWEYVEELKRVLPERDADEIDSGFAFICPSCGHGAVNAIWYRDN